MNPYYDAEELSLKIISFDMDDLSYEFDTLCFWATPDGRVYTAQDSGCSCPTPFEGFEGDTMDDVVQLLERVKDLNHAEQI